MSGKRALAMYPGNQSARLDLRLFRNPTSHYRGAPFWAWNDKLAIPRLLRQIDHFQSMGFGGFLIHSRTGLATEYLGGEFMDAVHACVRAASKKRMLAWLYDEDRWPSGFAGGLVTSDKPHRIKHLLWTKTPYGPTPPPRVLSDYTAATRSEDGTLLTKYKIVLKDGRLARYWRLKNSARARPSKDDVVWYAYLESPRQAPGSTAKPPSTRSPAPRSSASSKSRTNATPPR